MLAREPVSFWRENVVAVVTLLRVLARMLYGGNKLSTVRTFSILQSGEGSTSFNNDNSAKFLVEKNSVKNSGVSIICEYAKKLSIKSRTRSRSRPPI